MDEPALTELQRMSTITVVKLDHSGVETYRYQGQLLERSSNRLVLEAFFDRDDTRVDKIIFKRGDRFIETYYTDRWYNILEIHDKDDDSIKCWYCNISFPAFITDNELYYRDLALDLLIYTDGRQVILDESEFKKLPLDENTIMRAQAALFELRRKFSSHQKNK